jgi:hypothetical protein
MYIPAVVSIDKKTIRNKTEKNNDKRSIDRNKKDMSSASSEYRRVIIYIAGPFAPTLHFCIVYY